MIGETLRPENQPNILEDHGAFVNLVKDVSSNKDPEAQVNFKKWLLGQWTDINTRISQAPWGEPEQQLGGDRLRIVEVSKEKAWLVEYDLDEERNGYARVNFGTKPMFPISLETKGQHWTRIAFVLDSKTSRNLTKVRIEDYEVYVNEDGKPSVQHNPFVIKVSPIFDIEKLDTHGGSTTYSAF